MSRQKAISSPWDTFQALIDLTSDINDLDPKQRPSDRNICARRGVWSESGDSLQISLFENPPSKEVASQQQTLQVVRKLGSGSYGAAYQVRDPVTKSKFTLKTIKLTKKSKIISGILEVQTLRRIRSLCQSHEDESVRPLRLPCPVWFACTGRSELLLLLTYLPGKPLYHGLKLLLLRPASWTDFCLLLRRLTEPIIQLHSVNVAHLDLKMDNFLLEGSTNPSLIDLGLACRRPSETGYAKTERNKDKDKEKNKDKKDKDDKDKDDKDKDDKDKNDKDKNDKDKDDMEGYERKSKFLAQGCSLTSKNFSSFLDPEFFTPRGLQPKNFLAADVYALATVFQRVLENYLQRLPGNVARSPRLQRMEDLFVSMQDPHHAARPSAAEVEMRLAELQSL